MDLKKNGRPKISIKNQHSATGFWEKKKLNKNRRGIGYIIDIMLK